MIRIAIIFIALHAAMTGALAQNAYKCGNTYSQAPCAGGTVVDADDARSTDQKRQTGAAAQRDARAAAALEKERLAQEAKAAPAYIPPAREAQADTRKPAVMTKPEKPKYFTAIAPAKPGDAKAKQDKTKKKAAKKAATDKARKA